MDDTDRLIWIVENQALIHTVGKASGDCYYFMVYKNGETSDADADFRVAIDIGIGEAETMKNLEKIKKEKQK